MNKLMLITALALICASSVRAQKQDALDRLMACFEIYAAQFSKTKEVAGDIADAAMAACGKYKQSFIMEISDPDGAQKLTMDGAKRIADQIMQDLRNSAVRTVIETRNKSVK